MRGKTAIAKLVYEHFQKVYASIRFDALKNQGARTQRLLWASTSTKNPQYRDVLYVEELIGPNTINTVPSFTLKAFRDHGQVQPRLAERVSEAKLNLNELKTIGIDMDKVTHKLKEDGVAAFVKSFDSLMKTLTSKRDMIVANRVSKQSLNLGRYTSTVDSRLKIWTKSDMSRRLWQKDGTVWIPDPVKADRTKELTDRLGWLALPEAMYDKVDELSVFADEIKNEGLTQIVLLGMGGSSLAPEVFMTTFGNAPGYPPLMVLDSTDPISVKSVAGRIDPVNTLFLVSSKSGGTIEMLSFFKYFYDIVKRKKSDPEQNFVVLTDPGSKLEYHAIEKNLRRVFLTPPDVGGRYSALTYFGLLPAALIGVNLRKIIESALTMSAATHYWTKCFLPWKRSGIQS